MLYSDTCRSLDSKLSPKSYHDFNLQPRREKEIGGLEERTHVI